MSVDAAGTVITSEVDGLGRRVKRTKNGVSERYLWDGSRIAAVLDNAGAVLRRFVYATSGYVPDAILEGSAGTLYLVVKDERGSVRQLIDPAGLVAEKYEYDEWGKELSGPTPRKSLFGFAGGVYDPDTGLVRFGARDYDPAVGRWTTKDPSRFWGGTNLYGYANNDPVNFRDATGFAPEETGGREYGWTAEDASAWNTGVGWAVEALNAITSAASFAGLAKSAGGAVRAAGALAAGGQTCGGAANVSRASGGLSRAAEFGLKPYAQLRQATAGSGLHAHHLIEQRFASVMGQNARDMLAVAVTPTEHQAFTNAWRALIPYGPNGTGVATREMVIDAARQVYSSHPEILAGLGL